MLSGMMHDAPVEPANVATPSDLAQADIDSLFA